MWFWTGGGAENLKSARAADTQATPLTAGDTTGDTAGNTTGEVLGLKDKCMTN